MNHIVIAFRQFRRAPAFAITAVLAIALGIGVNAAIFSVVNTVLFRPLAFRQPEKLAMIWEVNFRRGGRNNVVAPANFLDWSQRSRSFESMSIVSDTIANLTGAGEPAQLNKEIVQASFFPMLGLQPMLGRAFTESDDQSAAPPVAILNHKVWTTRFGSNPSIVGRAITLNGEPVTVIGVMPANTQILGREVDVWTCGYFAPGIDYRRRTGRFMRSIARLKPGVSVDQAQAEMSGIARQLESEYPDFDKGWGVRVVPLHEQFAGPVRTPLLALLSAVGFVLLIACANVANLLLARAASREREIAIRSALGAGRGELVRQLLAESFALAALGAAAGVAVAAWLIRLVRVYGPEQVFRLSSVGLDAATVGYCAAATVFTAFLFGLAPALSATRGTGAAALKEGGRGGTAMRGNRLRSAFIVVQTALCLVLLIGAGLLLNSFVRLTAVDPGFDARNVLTLSITADTSKDRDPDRIARFFTSAIDRLRTLPGVSAASGITWLPFSGPGAATSIVIAGRPPLPAGEQLGGDVRIVHPAFFETMRIPLKRGRYFEPVDYQSKAPRKFLVNQALASQFFPNEEALGQSLRVAMGDDDPGEIVGVVGDVKYAGFDSAVRPMVYYPQPHLAIPFMTLVMRTAGDPKSFIAGATAAVREAAPGTPVTDVQTMEDWMAASVAQTRFQMALLASFAVLALILASVGLYGVISYFVERRTAEIGVRMALGASRASVVWLIMRQGLAKVLLGVAAGLVAAVFLTRLLTSLLFSVRATDPATYLAVTVLLALVAAAACLIPAARATRIDPIAALRQE